MPRKSPRSVPVRLRDAAALLPALGAFLFMPPAITLFGGGTMLAGIPAIVLYVFGVWLALIAGTAYIAHRLAPLIPPEVDAAPIEPPPSEPAG